MKDENLALRLSRYAPQCGRLPSALKVILDEKSGRYCNLYLYNELNKKCVSGIIICPGLALMTLFTVSQNGLVIGYNDMLELDESVVTQKFIQNHGYGFKISALNEYEVGQTDAQKLVVLLADKLERSLPLAPSSTVKAQQIHSPKKMGLREDIAILAKVTTERYTQPNIQNIRAAGDRQYQCSVWYDPGCRVFTVMQKFDALKTDVMFSVDKLTGEVIGYDSTVPKSKNFPVEPPPITGFKIDDRFGEQAKLAAQHCVIEIIREIGNTINGRG